MFAKLKNAGGVAGGVIIVIGFIAIPIAFLLGAAELSVWALSWIPEAIGYATLASILMLPLALIPTTRGFASNMYGLVSLLFGACLWLYALAFTYLKWGLIAVVIGVVFFGVGVIFTGTLAALLTASWGVLGNLALVLGLAVGTKLLSGWLAESAARRALNRDLRTNPSRATIVQGPES